MFHITDKAIAPHKPRFLAAVKKLPQVHEQATHLAMTHLHEQTSVAARQAGLDPKPLTVARTRQGTYLGIDSSPEGNQLFDQEFGTHVQSPSAVLRTAARKAAPKATEIYRHTIWKGLGL